MNAFVEPKLAPVAIYTYTRYDHLVQTLEALRANYLAKDTVIYVVSDGARNDADAVQVNKIRDYVDDITGFKEVVKLYREKNYGLKLSPPLAEQQILSDHGCIINMEDDNVTSRNYLDFMNAGLRHFESSDFVYSISGYCPPVLSKGLEERSDFWFYPWNLSWGYGVWKKKHDKFHPLKNNYVDLQRNGLLAKQNKSGGLYISDSMRRDFKGQKYFPDAILCTQMFAANMQTVVPTVSKVLNIGQDGSGQSSKKVLSKYDVVLDDSEQRAFSFESESNKSDLYRKNAAKFYNGSLGTRLARQFGCYHELLELKSKLGL